MPFYTKKNKLYHNKLRYNILPIDKSIISTHINSSTTNRLTNKTSADRLVYSSQNPYGGPIDAGIWVRNPNCWLNGITNISCFSPAQRSGANWWQRGGTLITRKHALFAKHFVTSILPNGGTPLIFVDENNNAIRRNIIQYGYDSTDIAVALLDSEVPANIKIAKVLAPNFTDYMNISIIGSIYDNYNTQINSFRNVPLLYSVGLDQEEKAIVKIFNGCDLYGSGSSPNTVWFQLVSASDIDPNISYTYYGTTAPDPRQFSSFSEPIIVGDSGNPLFLIIDNELVILCSWWTSSGGPFITNRYNEVNSIIESLSPGQGYSLTPVNLELVYHKYS